MLVIVIYSDYVPIKGSLVKCHKYELYNLGRPLALGRYFQKRSLS